MLYHRRAVSSAVHLLFFFLCKRYNDNVLITAFLKSLSYSCVIVFLTLCATLRDDEYGERVKGASKMGITILLGVLRPVTYSVETSLTSLVSASSLAAAAAAASTSVVADSAASEDSNKRDRRPVLQ